MPTEIDGAVVVISGMAAGFPSPHSRSEWRGGVGVGALALRAKASHPAPLRGATLLTARFGGGELPISCFALPKE
jgi:hypothetical protein